jgi:dsRNA-specific ribonuclease
MVDALCDVSDCGFAL